MSLILCIPGTQPNAWPWKVLMFLSELDAIGLASSALPHCAIVKAAFTLSD